MTTPRKVGDFESPLNLIAEGRRLLAEATSGNWTAHWEVCGTGLGHNGIAHVIKKGIHEYVVANTDQRTGEVTTRGSYSTVALDPEPVTLHPDAALIVWLRNNAAALLDAAERVERAESELRSTESVLWERLRRKCGRCPSADRRLDATFHCSTCWANAQARIAALEAREKALEGALRKYGRHVVDCGYCLSGPDCTCGLDAALAGGSPK